MMAGIRADLAALKERIAGEWVAYANREGVCTTLLRGTEAECEAYVRDNPRGPNGGSTHIAHRPRRPRERDEIACIRPLTLAPVRTLLVDPAAMTERLHRMNGGTSRG